MHKVFNIDGSSSIMQLSYLSPTLQHCLMSTSLVFIQLSDI